MTLKELVFPRKKRSAFLVQGLQRCCAGPLLGWHWLSRLPPSTLLLVLCICIILRISPLYLIVHSCKRKVKFLEVYVNQKLPCYLMGKGTFLYQSATVEVLLGLVKIIFDYLKLR